MKAERRREASEFRAQGEAEANRIRATAEREATVIKAEATRKGEQLRGEGDAERNRIFAEAYGRDQDFFAFYRSMQAYETAMKAGDTRLRDLAQLGVLPLLQRSDGKDGACAKRSHERSDRRRGPGARHRGTALGPRAASGHAPAGGRGGHARALVAPAGWIAVAVGVAIVWLIRG